MLKESASYLFFASDMEMQPRSFRSASNSVNLHTRATNIAPVTYLNGLLLFVAGLSIVRK